MQTITRTHLILQMEDEGVWHGIQTFDDDEKAQAALAESENGWENWRLIDRSYEIEVPEV